MLSVYFETYGCSNNVAETEIMKGLLKQAGLELTNNEKVADIFIINTCIVKGPTINSIKRRIQDIQRLGKPIIVAGCMPASMSKEITQLNETASMVSTHNIKKIASVVKKVLDGKIVKEIAYCKDIKLNKPRIRTNNIIAIVPISSGCLGYCSFCSTRIAKGEFYSFPERCILTEISTALKQGCKEIWITSQDNAAYGLNNGKRALPDLLKKILSLKGKFKIRLGMMNPENILPILNELIECYKNEKMYKFLHIPLQSGSNKILELMNRKYKVKDFLEIVNKFRKEIPDLTLATDIIAGYPQESEQDFQETLKLIEQVKPAILNVSKFWAIKGTPASKENQIPKEIAKERATRLMDLFKKIAKESNEKYLGKETCCLAYDKFQDYYLSRTPEYKLALIKSGKNILGKIVKVKIIGVEKNHLIGELIL